MPSTEPLFQSADPYQDDLLALPVADVDAASSYYSSSFGMVEVSRSESPNHQVIMGRDGVRIGFAENGGDSSQDGAAILVADAQQARDELTENGVEVSNWRIDERDGAKYQVFFVVAPDGLCYYFYAPTE